MEGKDDGLRGCCHSAQNLILCSAIASEARERLHRPLFFETNGDWKRSLHGGGLGALLKPCSVFVLFFYFGDIQVSSFMAG